MRIVSSSTVIIDTIVLRLTISRHFPPEIFILCYARIEVASRNHILSASFSQLLGFPN